MFKDYTEEQLKNIGFGPISIKAIKDVAGAQSQQTSNGLTDEEKQFIQQYNKAANSRKPEDRAFLTSENAKRYSDLIKKQNEAKKVNRQNKRDQKMEQRIAAAKQDNIAYGDTGTFGE